METFEKVNQYLGTNYKSDEEIIWWSFSAYRKLSEDFIRELKDKVNWYYISRHQKLSESFIREFKDKVDWVCISYYQNLSESFISEFKDRVDWSAISRHQNLSESFISEFKDKVSSELISKSWHYKDTKFKKKAVQDTGLYECHRDYFIAYKGIRKNRYSQFNFQYHYEKGGIYESWCDCSTSECSFGLSAWTKEGAKNYCRELLVRVKVRYEDVGYVSSDSGRIRCFKLEILD